MSESVSIKQALEKSGVISINPKGQSMFPFIKEGDTAIIKAPTAPLKKYDCVLFVEDENTCVLHRLIKINGDALTTVGDNNLKPDRPLKSNEVIGVLEGIYKRNGKYVEIYGKKPSVSVVLGCFYPFKRIRLFYYRCRRLISRIFKRSSGKTRS